MLMDCYDACSAGFVGAEGINEASLEAYKTAGYAVTPAFVLIGAGKIHHEPIFCQGADLFCQISQHSLFHVALYGQAIQKKDVGAVSVEQFVRFLLPGDGRDRALFGRHNRHIPADPGGRWMGTARTLGFCRWKGPIACRMVLLSVRLKTVKVVSGTACIPGKKYITSLSMGCPLPPARGWTGQGFIWPTQQAYCRGRFR